VFYAFCFYTYFCYALNGRLAVLADFFAQTCLIGCYKVLSRISKYFNLLILIRLEVNEQWQVLFQGIGRLQLAKCIIIQLTAFFIDFFELRRKKYTQYLNAVL